MPSLEFSQKPIRDIFSAFEIKDVALTYTAAGGKGKAVRELIISRG